MELSAADDLKELRVSLREEQDALAFHLRLHGGTFQSQGLVRAYLSNHFGSGSSAIRSYELAIANTNGAFFRAEAEESPFTAEAQAKIDYYANAARSFEDPDDYISFLDQEFATYIGTDLSNETNVGLALWLALFIESFDFMIHNMDLILSINSSHRTANLEYDARKCAAGIITGALKGAVGGCLAGARIAIWIGGPKGALAGCVVTGSVGFVVGAFDEWSRHPKC